MTETELKWMDSLTSRLKANANAAAAASDSKMLMAFNIAIDAVNETIAAIRSGAGENCIYCDATEDLRKPFHLEDDLICETCFTPTDDGPCFDDLPKAE